MVFVIDKRIDGLICKLPLVYFCGLSLYSFIPEFYAIEEPYKYAFFWLLQAFFMASITALTASLLINKKAKLLTVGASIFFVVLGIFQIVNCFVYIPKIVWLLIFPSYLIPYLLISKHVGSKLR